MVVLAPEPGPCCVRGFKHAGKPQGTNITLGGMESYISKPTFVDNSRIVIFFPDVFGPFFVNNQLLMDYFASNEYLVAAPDYFEGNPVHIARECPGFDQSVWINTKLQRTLTITPKWIDAVISELGKPATKYVTVGYCFGAPFVLDLLATDKVVAGAIAHPAFLKEDHFRKVTNGAAFPFLFCLNTEHAEIDVTFPAEARHTSEEIPAEVKATYQYQLFGGVSHGFALRGNMEVENERWAKEESASGKVGWWVRFAC